MGSSHVPAIFKNLALVEGCRLVGLVHGVLLLGQLGHAISLCQELDLSHELDLVNAGPVNSIAILKAVATLSASHKSVSIGQGSCMSRPSSTAQA